MTFNPKKKFWKIVLHKNPADVLRKNEAKHVFNPKLSFFFIAHTRELFFSLVTSFQLASWKEHEAINHMHSYIRRREKWWISLKLNSNKKKAISPISISLYHLSQILYFFVIFHSCFASLHNIFYYSSLFLPRHDKIIYQITKILFPYNFNVIYIKMSSIRMRQEIY